MRFKLDENRPSEMVFLFRRAGHDALSVLEQGFGGAPDSEVASICLRERRAIVTFDKDFADLRTYPPGNYSGIVVFRLRSQARDHVLGVARRFLRSLEQAELEGRLWIVEESAIRVRA